MNLAEYLLESSYREIVHHCRGSPEAREICENPIFWKQKALFDFNIPLEYSPKARTASQRYALLNKEYQRASPSLLLRLIRGRLLPQALELYTRCIPDYENEEKIMSDILVAAVESGREEILSTFARKISPIYPESTKEAYLKSIKMNRPDLTRILVQYHSPI